jgi:DNA-binding response OmpR family regulator
MVGLRKILLVEDNYELADIFDYFLKEHGFDVQIAGDGEKGLAEAKRYQPDLIFLDIMLPKIDGLEVLKKLRHDPQYNSTKAKIVLLTNLGDAAKVASNVDQDIDGYVVKADIELGDLLKIIKSLQHTTSRR